MRLVRMWALPPRAFDAAGRALTATWWLLEAALGPVLRRVFAVAERALAAAWRLIMTTPGARQVDKMLYHAMGLHALDRWLTLRDARANLTLADHLSKAGLHSQAATLRESASEAILRIRRLQ